MENLKHIRFVTENYSDMQGLRQIPLGACMALVGAISIASSMATISGWWIVFAQISLLVVGFGLYEWIGRRYNAVYGTVKSRSSGIPDWLWIVAAIGMSMIEVLAELPLSPTMLIIAAFFVYLWRTSNGLLPHYLPLALIPLIAISLPQLIGAQDRISWFLIVLGISQSIAGVFDHLALTRVLQRPAHESIYEEEYA